MNISGQTARRGLPPGGAARLTRRPTVVALAVVAGTGLMFLLPASAPLARADSKTLVVTSTSFGGADANPGDGVCETATGNTVCTLRAAIEESNALNGAPGQVTITVASDISLNSPMTAAANYLANFMSTTSVNRQDSYGAQYVVTAPVTIDLGHRLQPNASANGNSPNAMFYLNGPDISIINADNVLSSGSSFVIGPAASNIVIDGDTMGVNSGLGQISADVNYNPARFLVIMQGAQNVTVRNYRIAGYDTSKGNGDGGIFVFANPASGVAPATPTRNVAVDNVQVIYSTSTVCAGSNGVGCRTRIVNFWQGTNNGATGAGYANNVINGLSFTNMVIQNLSGGLFAFMFSSPDAAMTPTYSADVTNLVIENNRFLHNAVANTNPYDGFINLPYADHLHGVNSISNNVFTTDHTPGSQVGQGTAIFLRGTQPSGSTNPSNLTISNNYFDGYGNFGTIRSQQAGLVTVTGNTFGPASVSWATSAGETADSDVMVSNAPGTAPYASSNQAIMTWSPTTGNATVVTSVLPGGTHVAADPRNGALPTCLATVTATKPTSATSNNTIPADPVTLQVYWTALRTAEVYLGQVTAVSGPSAAIAFPLPIGPITQPDGTTVQIADPVTGAVNGDIRLQTHVEGLSQLESSQYSQVTGLTGTCRPGLTINQASGMADPTWARDLHFTLASAVPLDPATAVPGAIGLTATPVSQTVNPALINPRVVSVTPVGGSGNTAFDVVVRVDDSATVSVTVDAGAVLMSTGLPNPSPATSTDNSITYLNPLQVSPPQFTLVTGDPAGATFTVALAAGAPVPLADLLFTATVSQPPGAPTVSLSTATPVLAAGQTSTDPVTVTAAAGSVTANTPAPITMTVQSSDSNYDGLVVPPVTPRLFATNPTIQITKTAYVDVGDASSPAHIQSTGTLAPAGSTLTDGQAVCFVYTVTNTSADDWATTLTDVVVTDSDTRLGSLGVIGTIPVIAVGASAQLSACTVLSPVDATPGP